MVGFEVRTERCTTTIVGMITFGTMSGTRLAQGILLNILPSTSPAFPILVDPTMQPRGPNAEPFDPDGKYRPVSASKVSSLYFQAVDRFPSC